MSATMAAATARLRSGHSTSPWVTAHAVVLCRSAGAAHARKPRFLVVNWLRLGRSPPAEDPSRPNHVASVAPYWSIATWSGSISPSLSHRPGPLSASFGYSAVRVPPLHRTTRII